MQVDRVKLPPTYAPYSSWNSSVLCSGSCMSLACESGHLHVLDDRMCLQKSLLLEAPGINRFSHAWTLDGRFVCVAHGSLLSLYDSSFSLLVQQELAYFGRHVAISSTNVIVATSNGAYWYSWTDNTLTQIAYVFQEIPVTCAAFSACERWAALGAADGRVQIRRLDTFLMTELLLPSPRITSIAFDGNDVVFAAKDGHVDVFTYTEQAAWTRRYPSLRCAIVPAVNAFQGYPSSTLVAFYAKFLAVAHSSQCVELIEIESGRCVERIVFPAATMLLGLAFLPSIGLVLHDVSGELFVLKWKHAHTMLQMTHKRAMDHHVHQAVRLGETGFMEIHDSVQDEWIPAPFISPTTQYDTNALPWSTFQVIRHSNVLGIVLGYAVFVYENCHWKHWIAPTGIACTVASDGFLFVLSAQNHSISQVNLSSLTITSTIMIHQEFPSAMQLRLEKTQDDHYLLQLTDKSSNTPNEPCVRWQCTHRATTT